MHRSDPPFIEHWPRYSARALPIYRFLPGHTPHPRRNPQGHSFGLPEPRPPCFHPRAWETSEDYRYAIDLYNFGYWWESHEIFEGFWHVFGRKTEEGLFFQALIQIAAANLKHHIRHDIAAGNLVQRGINHLKNLPSCYMGIDLVGFTERLTFWAGGRTLVYVPIELTV